MQYESDARIRPALRALALASMLCCALTAARVGYSARITYLSFCWNLLLAWVPLGLSLVLARWQRPGKPSKAIGFWVVGALWLAFFPNAPYIVTDIIHLSPRSPVPLWFDVVLVFAFAFTGLGLAFISLLLVHSVVRRWRGSRVGWLFVAVVAGLTGFGVYLGRFQRWNSWDLIMRPDELLVSALREFLHPTLHPRPLGMTVVFGAFFGVAYLVLFTLTGLRPQKPTLAEAVGKPDQPSSSESS
jgi:uncharacterized membrane protein